MERKGNAENILLISAWRDISRSLHILLVMLQTKVSSMDCYTFIYTLDADFTKTVNENRDHQKLWCYNPDFRRAYIKID